VVAVECKADEAEAEAVLIVEVGLEVMLGGDLLLMRLVVVRTSICLINTILISLTVRMVHLHRSMVRHIRRSLLIRCRTADIRKVVMARVEVVQVEITLTLSILGSAQMQVRSWEINRILVMILMNPICTRFQSILKILVMDKEILVIYITRIHLRIMHRNRIVSKESIEFMKQIVI
jgi:hypothetical protein